MTESEALAKMVAPGTPRPGKYRQGVIQIHITRACDKSCFGCTQGSNLGGKTEFMSLEHFDQACKSLKGYWGVVGVFGGNPALHPQFVDLCIIIRDNFTKEQCGLWCNNPVNEIKARAMRETFDPAVSNLNVHLDREAYDLFKKYWPESRPFGLDQDSRHSPPYVAMKDVVTKAALCDDEYGCPAVSQVPDDSRIWELISGCDINQHWSAMIGVFRGQLRAWFCEVAGAQAMLHQGHPDYPDTGLDPMVDYCDYPKPRKTLVLRRWWEMPMSSFADQVRKHCFDCGVPLRGYGELAQAESQLDENASSDVGAECWTNPKEQVSQTHVDVYKPKRKGRQVQVITNLEQLGTGRLHKFTDYLGNSKR